MSIDTKTLTVVDVYDQAANIGKEFERMIDCHGPESVTHLMPKVIEALEYLELLATANEREQLEVMELKDQVARLQAERAGRLYERDKYEQELESIEDSWKEEGKEMLRTVTLLQEENKRLRESLNERSDCENKNKERELELVAKMKDTVEKQRAELRAASREIQQKNFDLEAMAGQLERIARANAELRNKQHVTQRQTSSLIADKTELEVVIQDREQHIANIMEKMKSLDDSEERQCPQSPVSPISACTELSGKLVVDLSDPNRPRFTMHELRQVLLERNELKTKLIQLEEQLAYYRPKEEPIQSDSESSVEKEPDGACAGMSKSDYDRPVQGPINKEPDEKLFEQKSASGIRRLFLRVMQRIAD